MPQEKNKTKTLLIVSRLGFQVKMTQNLIGFVKTSQTHSLHCNRSQANNQLTIITRNIQLPNSPKLPIL